MFRELRRKEKKINKEESIDILNRKSWGVLSVLGDEGYPYGIPLNYVYSNNSIYIHGALNGHKIDSITKESKVSFTVVDYDTLIPEKFDTLYKSVIIFGKAEVIENFDEKRNGFMKFIEKFSSDFMISGEKYVDNLIDKTNLIKVSIEHVSGKIGK